MEVLVTGGAGFIGSHLCDHLISKGCNVTVIDDLSTGRNKNLSKKVDFIQADISKQETWNSLNKNFNALFHLAAKTSVTESVKIPSFYFQQNVITSQYIYEWSIKNNVKNVIYANTAGALYGDAFDKGHNESSLPKPKSPYGATKYACELFLMSLPINFTSIRLANVYGERQITKGEAGVIPIFTENIHAGKDCIIFGKNKMRDYIHVTDVCEYFVRAFEKMLPSQGWKEIFNVGTGVKTEDEKVFNTISSVIKKPAQMLYADKRDGEIDVTYLDISKAKEILEYEPKIEFVQGCSNTVRYYLENEF
jgi:UDP-glucose 4-epimerase